MEGIKRERDLLEGKSLKFPESSVSRYQMHLESYNFICENSASVMRLAAYLFFRS